MVSAFRIITYLTHYLSAWNTGGEGIHSPYLFYLVRMLMYDENKYYVWDAIEQQRRTLLSDNHCITVTDYGTGHMRKAQRTVAHIARTSLENARIAQLLFRWIVFLSHQAQRPLHILELGTSLGITTAYLATANSRNQIVTLEGSPETLHIAQKIWKDLHIKNIQSVEGNIDDLLSPLAQRSSTTASDASNFTEDLPLLHPLDMVFFDANHTYDATLRYWNTLLPYHHDKSVFVLDDIHLSPQMQAAWQAIQRHPAVTSTFDLYRIGVVFFDPHFLHKHYRLRY